MTQRVTIRKEGKHRVVSIGGRGMSIAKTKREAEKKAKQYRKQLKNR